ncbi:MAG: ATP-grasp domain-containing protein [Hamadaea sp.]|nr:ATP-grasp domain-containing protein [Hamadaea sp.]
MSTDIRDYRLVTASAYPGMMAPLTVHPSCICILSGDADHGTPGGAATPARLSLEKLDGVRRRWRFGDVARLADFVPKVLADVPADDRPVLLIPPRASLSWQAAATAWPGRVRLAASPMAVTEPLAEDKIAVRAALRELGLPLPRELILAAADVDFAAVARRLGTPFVLQTPGGAGGQGTYLIRATADLTAALREQPHAARWLVSEYAGDTTINAAGLVYGDGVRLLPVSAQSSGITELGFGFGAYCGSTFGPDAVPADVAAQAGAYAEVVGHWLGRLGHRGMYGVDIAVDGTDLRLLEVNPRIQGSSWLLSGLQAEPCLVAHVEAVLGAELGTPVVPAQPVRTGSHLLMRWTGSPGVVHGLPSLGEQDGVSVTGLPERGVTLLPGAIMARLAADHVMTTADGRGLTPDTEHRVRALRDGFDITVAAATH